MIEIPALFPLGPCRPTPGPPESLYVYPFTPWNPIGLPRGNKDQLTDLSRPCILVGTSLYDPEIAIACTKLVFSFLYLYHLLNIVKQRYRDVWGVFVCINMNLFVTGDLHRAHNLQKQLKVMIICWIHLYHYELVLCYIGCLCFCLIVSILACNVLLMFQCSDSLWSFWWCM